MIGRSLKALLLTIYVLLMLALPEAAARAYFAALLGPRILWYGTSHFRNAAEVAGMSADDDRQHHRSGREGFLKLQADLNQQTVETHARRRQGFNTYYPHETRYH